MLATQPLLRPVLPGWTCLGPWVGTLPGGKFSNFGEGAEKSVDQQFLLGVDRGRKDPAPATLPLLRPMICVFDLTLQSHGVTRGRTIRAVGLWGTGFLAPYVPMGGAAVLTKAVAQLLESV